MPERTADAEWRGNLRDGRGTMRFGSGAYEGEYTYASRFEQGRGTNPEELIGAAHAGCFSMALAGDLARAGHVPERIHTTSRVRLEAGAGGARITSVVLDCEAEVPDLDETTFQEFADKAGKNCPVSRALAGVEVSVNARLVTAK